ncbi:MAG TPA: hypothetical protein VGC86_07960 [Afipia sp.]
MPGFFIVTVGLFTRFPLDSSCSREGFTLNTAALDCAIGIKNTLHFAMQNGNGWGIRVDVERHAVLKGLLFL